MTHCSPGNCPAKKPHPNAASGPGDRDGEHEAFCATDNVDTLFPHPAEEPRHPQHPGRVKASYGQRPCQKEEGRGSFRPPVGSLKATERGALTAHSRGWAIGKENDMTSPPHFQVHTQELKARSLLETCVYIYIVAALLTAA